MREIKTTIKKKYNNLISYYKFDYQKKIFKISPSTAILFSIFGTLFFGYFTKNIFQ